MIIETSSTNSQSPPTDHFADHTYSFTPRPIVKNLQRKLHIVGSQKRERSVEQKLGEHVPDMVRELEVSSTDVVYDSQSPKPAKMNKISTTSGRGRGRGRGRSWGKGRGKCR